MRAPRVCVTSQQRRRASYLPFALLVSLVAIMVGAGTAAADVPILTKVSPHKGNVVGNETVKIVGKGFHEVSSVMFGSVPAVSYEVVSKTEILAVTPPHSAGRIVVTVTTPGGTAPKGNIKENGEFGYQDPTVKELSPAFGPALGGTFVTVTGTGFAEGSGETVFVFGNQTATTVECTSLTSCLVIAPPAVGKPGKPQKDAVIVQVGGKASSRKGAPEFEYE